MRDVTAQQIADLTARERQELRWVEIADSSGVLRDFTNYNGVDFVDDVEVTEDVERNIMTASIRLFREVHGVSLSPLMNASAPAERGRRAVIKAAVIPEGATVSESDKWTLFDGTIDVDRFGGRAPVLDLQCQGPGRKLRRTWIDGITTYGSDTSPVAMQTVMQQLMDAHLSPTETLNLIGDPAYPMNAFPVGDITLWDILQKIAAKNAWDFRYWWDDGSGAFVPTFQQPPRSKTTPDHTFTTNDHFGCTELSRDARQVRAQVRVRYKREAGQTFSAVADDSGAQDEFDDFPLVLDAIEDPNIETLARGEALAGSALLDTAQPPVTHETESRFFPPIQLFDLYRYEPDDLIHGSAVDRAVQGYTHQIKRDPRAGWRTIMRQRGQPAGSVSRYSQQVEGQRIRDTVEAIGISASGLDVPDAVAAVGATIGFTGGGRPLITLEAGERAVGVIGTIAVNGTANNILVEAQTAAAAAVSVGAGSVTVEAASGYAGYWCSISDGDQAEVFYCDTHSAGVISLLAGGGFLNAYPVGATVRRFVERVADKGMGVAFRFGTVTCDGTGAAPTASPEVGDLVEVFAKGVGPDGTLGQAVRNSKRRGDVEYRLPTVTVIGTRSGDDVSLQFDIDDPSLASTTGLRYKRRDGDDQTWDGAWQTGWDSSTGSYGTNKTLSRQKTFSDPYTAVTWELIGRDENGDQITLKNGTTEFASVIQLGTKRARIVPSDWKGIDETQTWNLSTSGVWTIDNGSNSGTSTFQGIPDIAKGCLLTQIQVVFTVSSGGSGEIVLRDTTNGVTLATLTGTSTGPQSATLNFVLNANLRATLELVGSGTAPSFADTCLITYATPSYKQTY